MLNVAPVEIFDRHQLVYRVPHFLTAFECDEFIARSEREGYAPAPITTEYGPISAPETRNNLRVMVDDVDLAEAMWTRVRPLVPEWLLEWTAVGVNERFRFYRYDPRQYFKRHYDGCFTRSAQERSQLSFMMYLNDDFEGGATTFFTDRGAVRFQVRPERGTALLFLHAQLHEGATVTRGRKYVMRSDVMYRRSRLTVEALPQTPR